MKGFGSLKIVCPPDISELRNVDKTVPKTSEEELSMWETSFTYEGEFTLGQPQVCLRKLCSFFFVNTCYEIPIFIFSTAVCRDFVFVLGSILPAA